MKEELTVKRVWIFFEEGGQDYPEFEIEASNSEEAFELAYDTYGPQVNNLYCTEKKK